MCVWGVGVCVLALYVQSIHNRRPEENVCLNLLKQGLSVYLGLDWWPQAPVVLLPQPPTALGFQAYAAIPSHHVRAGGLN